jgi:hypothetical protein
MADDKIDEHLKRISNNITTLSDQLATKKKDWWDRLSALSPFVGGVLVAGVGLYFTVTSQNRQIEINEVDLAVKFFPYITAKDTETRTQAYSVIQAVGGTLLIAKLAPLGGKSVEPALIAAQTQSNDAATKQSINNAIRSVQVVAAVQGKLGLAQDGRLGPETVIAIARYQEKSGMRPSGIIDISTLKKLGLDSAEQPINAAN